MRPTAETFATRSFLENRLKHTDDKRTHKLSLFRNTMTFGTKQSPRYDGTLKIWDLRIRVVSPRALSVVNGDCLPHGYNTWVWFGRQT